MHADNATHPAAILPRPHLLDLVTPTGQRFPPFILLLAPAGFGKSELATELIEVAALHLLRIYRTRCIAKPNAEFWNMLRSQLSSRESPPQKGKEHSAHDWVRRHVADLSEPILIVIDAYHRVSDAETDQSLVELSYSSEFVCIMVLARSVRVLDGPHYSERVFTIGEHELAFSSAEIHKLATHFIAELTQELTQSLDLTGGWPLAVTAVLRGESRSRRTAKEGRASRSEASSLTTHPQIHPRLVRLADDSLELLGDASRKILLIASIVETLSLEQVAANIEQPEADALKHMQTLLELGLISRTKLTHRKVFRIHAAVRPTLLTIAIRTFSAPARAKLIRVSARERESRDPLGALRMYVESSSFAEAEKVLATHFTRITDHISECASLLTLLSEAKLRAYPTFAAARLLLEAADLTVSQERLQRLAHHMLAGATERTAENLPPETRLSVAHRVQVMVGERLLGNTPRSLAVAREIESQLTMGSFASEDGAQSQHRDDVDLQPAFLQELAFTAVLGGDDALARRAWKCLESQTAAAQGDLPAHKSVYFTREADRQTAWQLAALNGLAILETSEGDFAAAADLLSRADAIRQQTGISAPALAWVNGEVTRAHLACQLRDESMLREAVERISPWSDRIEHWPMILLAEVENTRMRDGPDWAIPQLRSGITHVNRERHRIGVWGGYLAIYQVLLNTTLGNFAISRRILRSLPSDNVFVLIEQARLAVFSGDDVRALLDIQQLGVASLTKRQQIDRHLIAAIAARKCGRDAEAFRSLRSAGELIESCGLSMMLGCVPFEPLFEVAAAARQAGVCDLTAALSKIPERIRCAVRERLTAMEQRALETMSPHPSLAAAAVFLSIAPATMKRHRLAVYRKLKVGSREEAILQGTRMGLLTPLRATRTGERSER